MLLVVVPQQDGAEWAEGWARELCLFSTGVGVTPLLFSVHLKRKWLNIR